MASGMTPAKRFLVRMSLVTGSTLATIVGAQSLIALDGPAFSKNGSLASPSAAVIPASGSTLPVQVAPPSIIILGSSGQPQTALSTISGGHNPQSLPAVQPPRPVVIVPPSPVVVSAPAMPMTRSSR